MKRNKRTHLDFSKHELLESRYINEATNHAVLIHDLKIPNSSIHRFCFINTCGIMSVTGDYGNWIFCREFHPSSDGYVSEGYWLEKLTMNSIQDGEKYSSEETHKEINRLLDGGLKDWFQFDDEDDPRFISVKESLEQLKTYTDDELEYTYNAYRDNDIYKYLDYEDIPYVKVMNPRLSYIFDAFEEICNRVQ